MGDEFPLIKYVYNVSFPATHAHFPALELCSPKMCIGGQPSRPEYGEEGQNRE